MARFRRRVLRIAFQLNGDRTAQTCSFPDCPGFDCFRGVLVGVGAERPSLHRLSANYLACVGLRLMSPKHLEQHGHYPARTNQQQGVRSNILSRDAAIDVKGMAQETGN